MKKLFIVLALMVLATPSYAQFVNPARASIKAVAVTSGEQPRGVAIDISVVVTDGDGSVYVSTTPYTEIDMQGSAQLAALTACDLLGIDFMQHDFFYTIKADAPIVGGPSAGGVMCVATMAALANLSIKSDVFMTGMIYPDGFIGPVGGIPYKLQAAASNGAKIFLIPHGQKIVYVHERKEERRGPFIFISTETKPVDVVKLGEKLGVKVIEVKTVEEALNYYTGYMIEKRSPNINLSRYSNLLLHLAEKMKSSTLNLLNSVKPYASSEELNSIQKIINKANKSFSEGNYYTATSQYFTAEIKLRTIQYGKKLDNENELNTEFSNVERELNETASSLNVYKSGVESLQILGAAEERLAIAKKLIKEARASGDYTTAIDDLAFAKERIESAKLWLSLMPEIKKDVYLSKEDLKRRAELYLTQADSMIVYAKSIHGIGTLVSEAENSALLAQNQLSEGMYCGAAISSIDAITKAAISIELINADKSFISSEVNSSENYARVSLSMAEKYMTPVLPAAYFEFGKTSSNPIEKLYYYKLSARIAKLMSSMAGVKSSNELVRNQIKQNTQEKTNTKNVRVTPGFECMLSVVILASLAYLKRER